jgi:hypothetical protein
VDFAHRLAGAPAPVDQVQLGALLAQSLIDLSDRVDGPEGGAHRAQPVEDALDAVRHDDLVAVLATAKQMVALD